MIKQNALLISACMTILYIGNVAANDLSTRNDGFTKIAEGVYEKIDADGNITRMAYGDAGADFDRENINNRIAAIEQKSRPGSPSQDEVNELANLQEALAGLPSEQTGVPSEKAMPISPQVSVRNTFCSSWFSDLDTQLVVGSVAASAIARAGLEPDAVGPVLQYGNLTVYTSATITPSGGASPITVTHSSTSTQALTALADSNLGYAAGPIGPSGCTASTYSYLSASNTACPLRFVSQTKSYTSCVTTP
jgi:hypothetical protein